MSKKSTAATRAPKTPSPNEGAVAELGRELAQLIKNDPENWAPERKKDRSHFAAVTMANMDRREAILASMSFASAETPADALAVVVVATATFNELFDFYVPQDLPTCANPTESDRFLFEAERTESTRLARTLYRCLHSLRRYFESQHGLNASDFGGDWYMEDRYDPFALLAGEVKAKECPNASA